MRNWDSGVRRKHSAELLARRQVMSVEFVIPMLVCRDANAEIAFCVSVFGAAELSRRVTPSGSVVHATLRIGEALLMVHGVSEHLASRPPDLDGSSDVVIYVYVHDVDDVLGVATHAGARVLLPPENMFWGDRVARIMDGEGHVWNIASRHGTRSA